MTQNVKHKRNKIPGIRSKILKIYNTQAYIQGVAVPDTCAKVDMYIKGDRETEKERETGKLRIQNRCNPQSEPSGESYNNKTTNTVYQLQLHED
jgi:hypothetical protein